MRPDIPAIRVGSPGSPLPISPTDVSQFIRLDQCQRFLRLRLHARRTSLDFLHAYDVQPQGIPPILSQSGADFEREVERSVAERYPSHRFSQAERTEAGVADDNAAIVARITALPEGGVTVLFQPRLQAVLGGWKLRGDVDLVRCERSVGGNLRLLIADMKSSTASKVEHRLQVAFYHEMLASILLEAGVDHAPIDLAILYRGPAQPPATSEQVRKHEAERAAALEMLGASVGLLERLEPQAAYIDAVHDLVLGGHSHANRIVATPFDDLPFHLTMKCDGCLFNEFCMKQAAESDDLSLLPHLTENDKAALKRGGVTTTTRLANLMDLVRKGTESVDGRVVPSTRLVPAAGEEATVRALSTTWPVGPRLEELVHRARRYRSFKRDPIESISWLPNRGYSSLPFVSDTVHPNLVMVYIDVQHDYLFDRLYLLGALVVGHEGGRETPARRRTVVRFADGPPDTHEAEQALLTEWVAATVRAVADVAAPDADGELKAPIHLVFANGFAQKALLDALARHTSEVMGTTALYDFVTQIAAFDSPIATQIEQQIREKKNYPMVCQSLQSVAAFLKFSWNAGRPFRQLFHTQMFDYVGWLGDPVRPIEPDKVDWITRRARFNSQVPLEYAYNAWGELPQPAVGARDDFAGFREVDRETLIAFHARRLEAMEHVTNDLDRNLQTELTAFSIPDLGEFVSVAPTLAHALDEFVMIERHIELAAWKQARHAAPEQRVLAGNTLLVRYVEEDQFPGVAEQNRENERRRLLGQELRATWRQQNPDAKRVTLPKDQREAVTWDHGDTVYRLRIETEGVGCDLNEALALSTIKEGERLIIFTRHTVDGRLPVDQQRPFTPTPKQLPWGLRADLKRIEIERRDGRAVRAWAEVTLASGFGGGNGMPGFVFPTIGDHNRPLVPNELYTLDPDPNSWTGLWASNLAQGLIGGGQNPMYSLLAQQPRPAPDWPPVFVHGQRQFLAGLDALRKVGAFDEFEKSKRDYIGGHGLDGLLMVQGPPGTGKSFSTAYALLARFQGAMQGGRKFRVVVSCKTHAATDVLIENVAKAQERLETLFRTHPDVARAHFDRRLLDIPLFRYRGRAGIHHRIADVPHDRDRPKENPPAPAWQRFENEPWCVIAGTPGSLFGLVKDRKGKEMFGQDLAHCLVLDEASQMSLPEAIMAAMPLAANGNVIVVGDHRQMPPIVANDWANERRRTFAEFRTYESLFLTLLAQEPPIIRFSESFRLHADMAEFLKREIYVQDGIDFHSRRRDVLPRRETGDSFVAAVLDPEHPLTVVVHDEAQSQVRNDFERQLLTPILAMVADPAGYGLRPDEGFGVVVPHRAQRASLQETITDLRVLDPATGELLVSGVDTVERYQGDERLLVVFDATESDRDYLIAHGSFLLDPRRLNVALSRAKQKMILVASRSVFELFSADEETFQHAQLWKNLLRHTCTALRWEGERHGHHVEVWGNRAISMEEGP